MGAHAFDLHLRLAGALWRAAVAAALGYYGATMATVTVTATQSPEQMLQVLADGGEHLRESLLAQLAQLSADGGQGVLVSLRASLLRLLAADSHRRVDDEEHSGSWTRSWQLSALVVIAGDDAESRRLIELYADRTQEPNRWVRYWTLATASGRKELAAWSLQRAEAIARDPGEHLMLRCLAWALCVDRHDDPEALAALAWALAGAQAPFPSPTVYPFTVGDPPVSAVVAQSAALRALRVVPLPQLFERVQSIVDEGPFASYTWDALTVLGRFGSTARAAEASHTLARFVAAKRRMREFYDMVGVAVHVHDLPVLHPELNPAAHRTVAADRPVVFGALDLQIIPLLRLGLAAELQKREGTPRRQRALQEITSGQGQAFHPHA